MEEALGHGMLGCELRLRIRRGLQPSCEIIGKTHFGRVFPIVVEKGSELPPDQRKYKGRVVFQGNNVKDQDNNVAVFNDLASSAALMVASKFVDFVASLSGNDCELGDAQQAYTQALLRGNETWIFLPRDQWPNSWKKFRNPVCRLKLALYGHPLSGAFWENIATNS